MSPALALWLFSVAGAALFFAAGFLLGGRRRAPAGPEATIEEALALLPEHPGGAALQGLAERVARRDGRRGAVVTDEIGLVVASSGEHGEALAAVGALLAGAGARAGSDLPIGAPRHLHLRDELGAALSVHALGSGHAALFLVTLGPGAELPGETKR